MPWGYELEQAGNLAGLDIHVDTAISGVSSGAGHHGDGAGHGAQELRAAVLQNVADEQTPAGGNTLLGGIVGQGQVGLDHHGAVVGVLGIGLEALGLLDSHGSPVDTVGTVDLTGDQVNALTQRHLQIVQELDLVLGLTGFDNDLSFLQIHEKPPSGSVLFRRNATACSKALAR